MMVQATHHRNRQLALACSRAERNLILIVRAVTKPVPGTLQEGGAPFQTTHWTVVLQAAKADSDESRKALSTFSEAYWPPLYAFIRRRGYPSTEAQDLTQSFFAHLLEHEILSRADQRKGRLRTFPVLSSARVAGFSLDEFSDQLGRPFGENALGRMAIDTRAAGVDIVDAKGATYYGIGAALVRIIRAILRDEDAILTVSSRVPEAMGLGEVSLSLPSIVNRNGIAWVLPVALNASERKALEASAEVVRRNVDTLAQTTPIPGVSRHARWSGERAAELVESTQATVRV